MPIRMGDAVVGVVNVECQRDLPDAFVAQLEACAAAYAARLTAMGGPPRSSPAQRLVGHVTELAGRVGLEEIELAVLEAALDVTSMDSAMLLREDAYGCSVPQRAVGPLATALYACPPVTIAVIESFVDAGTSCYTVDQPGGGAPQGMRALRAAGAEALIALAVGPEEGRRGLLIVARTTPGAPTSEEVELLELLVAQARTVLRTAEVVAELRERAARDPLTGLGHHATFHEALTRVRAEHRDHVAVLIADIDGFKVINDGQGHLAGDRVLREAAAALSGALRRGDELFRIGGDEFAALVSVADEAEALDAARRLRAAATTTGTVTVSIGVAMPSEGESDAGLLARADRALYSVKKAGRNGVALDGAPPERD